MVLAKAFAEGFDTREIFITEVLFIWPNVIYSLLSLFGTYY
jgi:hypothetical protein